ncbi:hypothetical protein [Flavobacterium sp.]|uniref:XAC2610-related protein n=1 Tax=Flavobacterium sp. TaxID=239 RepID=UPI001226318D|nr:hypothetical protein [Flavobacterium sp.]RZJ73990.1 MAG: hypothetical protein EOO49_01140 [Flavobacterium sp.]
MRTFKSIPILYLLLVFAFADCGNKKISDKTEKPIADTVSKTEITIAKPGSVIKTSEPFRINGLECVWEQTDTLVDEGKVELIKIRDTKTRRLLLKHIECCLKYGFDFASADHFRDVNFDGFNDFLIRSYGSSAENEITSVYLFNRKTKNFELSNDLSDNSVEVDSVRKILVTGNFGRYFETTKHHRFDKSGKLESTETFSDYLQYVEGEQFQIRYKEYQKVVKGKIVVTKRDSVIERYE